MGFQRWEYLLGFEPGVEGLVGYPNHWYDQDGKVPCPARDCPVRFDASNIGDLTRHWYAKFYGPGYPDEAVPAPSFLTIAEHDILYNMLTRYYCPVPFCDTFIPKGGKELLYHEAEFHGHIFFNHMNGFVSLVRDYGNPIGSQQLVHEAIFTRMLLLIGENDQLRMAIFRRAKAEPSIDSSALDKILSPPNKRPSGPEAPIWEPIPSRDFLQDLWPTEEYLRDVDSSWKQTWKDLRMRYERGEI